MCNIYACYINSEGNWVVDGELGREVYFPRFNKETAIAIYRGKYFCYYCGKYNISVYEHDICYKGGKAALVQIDRFNDKNEPLDSKAFYLPDGERFDVNMTEKQIDKLYAKKEGSWI